MDGGAGRERLAGVSTGSGTAGRTLRAASNAEASTPRVALKRYFVTLDELLHIESDI